jgi:glycerol-3-phosphate cytidylyltransferase
MGKIIGYTSGVFDLFHIGHLNLLRNCKSLCDQLIVGVSTDEIVKYKNKKPVIQFSERIEIVRSNRYVDVAIPQTNLDKYEAWERLKFDHLYVGDDWYAHPNWKDMEKRFEIVGVRVVYFPYTQGVSSSLINKVLDELREGHKNEPTI